MNNIIGNFSFDLSHGDYWIAKLKKGDNIMANYFRFSDFGTRVHTTIPLLADISYSKAILKTALDNVQNYELLQIKDMMCPNYVLRIVNSDNHYSLLNYKTWSSRTLETDYSISFINEEEFLYYRTDNKENYIKKFNELKLNVINLIYNELIILKHQLQIPITKKNLIQNYITNLEDILKQQIVL